MKLWSAVRSLHHVVSVMRVLLYSSPQPLICSCSAYIIISMWPSSFLPAPLQPSPPSSLHPTATTDIYCHRHRSSDIIYVSRLPSQSD